MKIRHMHARTIAAALASAVVSASAFAGLKGVDRTVVVVDRRLKADFPHHR